MTLTLYCVYKYANKNACLFQVNCSLDILKTKTKKQKKKNKTKQNKLFPRLWMLKSYLAKKKNCKQPLV